MRALTRMYADQVRRTDQLQLNNLVFRKRAAICGSRVTPAEVYRGRRMFRSSAVREKPNGRVVSLHSRKAFGEVAKLGQRSRRADVHGPGLLGLAARAAHWIGFREPSCSGTRDVGLKLCPSYLAVPVWAQGETLGCCHLPARETKNRSRRKTANSIESCLNLATAVAEETGLRSPT